MENVRDTIQAVTSNIARLKDVYGGLTAELLRMTESTVKTEKQMLKAFYDERIQLAKISAESEIAAYKARISEIDAELKALDRKDADDDYADKIARLNESLKYETDGYNKRETEKEIDRLTKEYEKRKQRESLVDERDGLNELIKLTNEQYKDMESVWKQAEEVALASVSAHEYTQKGYWPKKGKMVYTQSPIEAVMSGGAWSDLLNAVNKLGGYLTDVTVPSAAATLPSVGNVTVYQTIQTPVKTPSEIAAEMRSQLEMMLRYGIN